MIIVESKRRKKENIERDILKRNPTASFVIVDVTSQAKDDFVHLSPFYPHGGIPVPFSPGYKSASVEGIWQGLKVFANEGVDTNKFGTWTMRDLKRGNKSRAGKPAKKGNLLGHRLGVFGPEDKLLDYVTARKLLFAPTYRWMLENRAAARTQMEKLKSLTEEYTVVVLLDYDSNSDINDPGRPLSHASLIKAYMEGNYPEEISVPPEYLPFPDLFSRYYEGQLVSDRTWGVGKIREIKERDYSATVNFLSSKAPVSVSLLNGTLKSLDTSRPFSFKWKGLMFRSRVGLDELEASSCLDKNAVRIEIPNEILDYPVTAIGERCFADMPRLESVSIPSTIKTASIAFNAFYGSNTIAEVKSLQSNLEKATIVSNAKGLWGVLANPTKRVESTPFEYEKIEFYAARLAYRQKQRIYYFLVKKNGFWGLLNKGGRQQAPCIYNKLRPKEVADLFTGFEFRRGNVSGIIDGKGIETTY